MTKLRWLKALAITLPISAAALAFNSNAANSSETEAPKLENAFSRLALDCVHKEFPNIIKHMMTGVEQVQRPKELYPAFYGCFDWHSSVHGHWLLVRILHKYPNIEFRNEIVEKLSTSFTEENIKGELAYLNRADTGTSFERPYGLAWFLQLTAELRQWQHPKAQQWLKTLLPLEQKIVANVAGWLPKLAFPIRVGEHSQTAFAFGLMLDWSRVAKQTEFEKLLTDRINYLYGKDVNCPLAYEPSGQDFLSPCIAEADLMRRTMSKSDYADWLTKFLPQIPQNGDTSWLQPATVIDKADGKLAHLDGLNLSRAWMLDGIASDLAKNDPRLDTIKKVATLHREAGIKAVTNDLHYMGSHWLGSFATYLLTERGIQ